MKKSVSFDERRGSQLIYEYPPQPPLEDEEEDLVFTKCVFPKLSDPANVSFLGMTYANQL